MEIYLIHHAQSTNQVLESSYDIVFDPHVTTLGDRQAEQLADFLVAGEERIRFAESGIDRLETSPMWRALQTTRPLAKALGLPPEVWVDVHEQVSTTDVRRRGIREEVSRAFPDFRLPDEVTDRGWRNRGSESRSTCRERAIRAAMRLWQRTGGDDDLAIVSHARFLDSLLKTLLDELPGRACWYHHSNTGISRVALKSERVEIRYLNRVAHWPPALVS